MASWFSNFNLNNVVDMESIKGLTETVQNAMPKLDHSTLLEKLTLTTPELTEERRRIDAEERRKENVRDALAGMYPWETRDPERDILVEECKDAILKLSANKETFFGPYPMPKKVNAKEEDEPENHEVETSEEATGDADLAAMNTVKMPSKESLEKLAKLEPLPPLLREFDLDTHVGLIRRLLAIDPQLVEMQSILSGGGEREKVFWRNYFFHCAYTRYEAGLSIDEIWSDQHLAPTSAPNYNPVKLDSTAVEEETVTFESSDAATKLGDSSKSLLEKAFHSDPTTDPDTPFAQESVLPGAAGVSTTSATVASAPSSATATAAAPLVNVAVVATAPSTSDTTDFEMVGGPDADGAGADDGLADYELDELEAEIAKELED